MIQIIKINRIYPILYLGVPYTVVETEAVLDDNTESTVENFSTESLARQLLDSDDLPKNKEAAAVDNEIYGYIPEELLKRSDNEICEWISTYFD